MMWTYVGVIGFLMLYLISSAYFAKPEYESVVALLDPFGLGAFEEATKYWTATERNTQLPGITGQILSNRLLWGSVALALLGVAWSVYASAAKGSRMPSGKASKKAAPASTDEATSTDETVTATRAADSALASEIAQEVAVTPLPAAKASATGIAPDTTSVAGAARHASTAPPRTCRLVRPIHQRSG